jgi:hypothetical protein
MPEMNPVFRIFLSRFSVFFRHVFFTNVFCVLNLPFVQDNPEWFTAFWTIEETDLQLHFLASFVWSTSHRPFLLWRTHFSPALWTLSHNISSLISRYDDFMVNE